eukprot:5439454-Heterocapsa_arctica.AAC.1
MSQCTTTRQQPGPGCRRPASRSRRRGQCIGFTARDRNLNMQTYSDLQPRLVAARLSGYYLWLVNQFASRL